MRKLHIWSDIMHKIGKMRNKSFSFHNAVYNCDIKMEEEDYRIHFDRVFGINSYQIYTQTACAESFLPKQPDSQGNQIMTMTI